MSVLILSVIVSAAYRLEFAKADAARDDKIGIEHLHQQDIAATLSGDPKALADLWTEDAVRLEPGGRADIGRSFIRSQDEKQIAAAPGARVLSYEPQIEDLQIVKGWAFEWGYFTSTYKESATGEVKRLNGKLLRVLQKQRDGSWRFSRVMWNELR